jgi:hypothetical protein
MACRSRRISSSEPNLAVVFYRSPKDESRRSRVARPFPGQHRSGGAMFITWGRREAARRDRQGAREELPHSHPRRTDRGTSRARGASASTDCARTSGARPRCIYISHKLEEVFALADRITVCATAPPSSPCEQTRRTKARSSGTWSAANFRIFSPGAGPWRLTTHQLCGWRISPCASLRPGACG